MCRESTSLIWCILSRLRGLVRNLKAFFEIRSSTGAAPGVCATVCGVRGLATVRFLFHRLASPFVDAPSGLFPRSAEVGDGAGGGLLDRPLIDAIAVPLLELCVGLEMD